MTMYKYTKGGATLTEDQRQFYEKNGYVVIRKLLREEIVDEVMQRFHVFVSGKLDQKCGIIMKDQHLKNQGVKGEHVIAKIQDYLYDEGLFKYCQEKAVLDIVEDIIGPEITAAHAMFFNKPPNTDPQCSLHPMHQNLYYFNFRPINNITAAWTALQKIDETNGCLYVLPGTHTLDLQKHGCVNEVKNLMFHGIAGFEEYPRVNLVMDKGDIVFFHPLVFHGSGANSSKGFRRAISCHFVNSNNHFINVSGTLQQPIEDELLEAYKVLRNVDLTFVDYFKMKSRLVKGPPGTFQSFTTYID